MTFPLASEKGAAERPSSRRLQTARSILKFLLTRSLALAAAVVTAVYLTILIANFGGYVDTMVKARIEEQVGFMLLGGWLADLPSEERLAQAEETIAAMQDAAGLNDPFLARTIRWLGDGLTLNWGRPERGRTYGANATNMSVGELIADNLSRTLFVFGSANILLFFAALFFALNLNRRYGGLLDRLFILLSPISAAPAWVFGILLSVFLLRVFGFSSGGAFDTWSGDPGLTSILITLRHLLLPFLAIFLAGFFQSAYNWRSYFLVYSNEEYVDMAYAKGLSKRRVDRHYIIRPALPALLTSFALLLAVLWQEVIALEYFFNVHGVGYLFIQALGAYDTPMIVAIVTTFAYLLVITLFILDLCYVLVDPRVRVGSREPEFKTADNTGDRFWRRGRRKTSSAGTALGSAAGRRRFSFSLPAIDFSAMARSARQAGLTIKQTMQDMRHYPAAVVGLLIIAILLAISIYTVIAIPYQEAITLWRGDDGLWNRNPRDALPLWVNLFRSDDLPPTLTSNSMVAGVDEKISELGEGVTDVTYTFTFDYDYVHFPQDIIFDITADYEERGPHVTITWVWEDGSEQELTSFQPRFSDSYYVSRDERLQRRLARLSGSRAETASGTTPTAESPHETILRGPDGEAAGPVPGTYTLRVNALHFEPESDLEVVVTILGQVYGLAGTDAQRRDLMIALLWGTPIALAFGLVAAVFTSVGGMVVAAVGAWYGGLIDRGIQFLTEVNLILPFFPVALMIFTLYSRNIVTILAVVVALSLLGSAVKTFRATFLQVRGSPYIEAARAYGASNWRIVSRYLIPRIITVLVPMMIILVPTYVFLEATLAFLGVSDPHLPTWGKLVVAALSYGVHANAAHIVIAPFGLLFLTGFAFAMVGITLERILEPRLQET